MIMIFKMMMTIMNNSTNNKMKKILVNIQIIKVKNILRKNNKEKINKDIKEN